MKKKRVIIAMVILILLMLLLGLIWGLPWEQHTKVKEIKTTVNTDTTILTKVSVNNDSTGSYNSDSTSSYNMDSLVINQAKTIDSLVQINLILVKKIKCQERNVAKKVRHVKPKRRQVAVQKPKPKPKLVRVKKVIAPAKKQIPKVKTIAQNTNLDEYRDHDGKIYFCVNLGGSPGRYLPHLALMRGEKFLTVVRNNDGGWNWSVKTPSPTMTGNYGVTASGIFYVSRSLIAKFIKKSDNDLVEIKTTVTNWQKKEMSLSKDGKYYIYKP